MSLISITFAINCVTFAFLFAGNAVALKTTRQVSYLREDRVLLYGRAGLTAFSAVGFFVALGFLIASVML